MADHLAMKEHIPTKTSLLQLQWEAWKADEGSHQTFPAQDIAEALREIVYEVLISGQVIAKRPLPSGATNL
jgi:hypothetical protein